MRVLTILPTPPFSLCPHWTLLLVYLAASFPYSSISLADLVAVDAGAWDDGAALARLETAELAGLFPRQFTLQEICAAVIGERHSRSYGGKDDGEDSVELHLRETV